ncbi:MAG: Ig-like domain-containing protein [Anaerolineaceae bacterium]|nr:Ig-like domain-containing protein [Anaerolineaceae bacterium]
MMKSFVRALLILMLISQFLAGCTPDQVVVETPVPDVAAEESEGTEDSEQTSPGEDLQAIMQGDDVIFPVVIESTPAFGETLTKDSDIRVRFDQCMDTTSVEDAWEITSSAEETIMGDFSWKNDDMRLVFTPTDPFEDGLIYDLSISEAAQSVDGYALEGGYQQTFYTAIPLQVVQVFPEPDSIEVDTGTQITAIFNQPVVPLKIVEEQGTLVQPLVFDPPVSGKGEWINTSVYVFQPDRFLHGSATYTVDVKQELQVDSDLETLLMAEPYQWRFETQIPEIRSIVIDGEWTTPPTNEIESPVSILPDMQIEFFQPMVKETLWNSVHLVSITGEVIPLRFKWNAEGTIVNFSPRKFLKLGGVSYTLTIDGDVLAQNGGTIQEPATMQFSTIEAPSIRSIYKTQYESIIVDFRTRMNPDSFEGHIDIVPPLPEMHWYYDSRSRNLVINGFLPSESYTVNILPGMTDIFGNAINIAKSESFTFDAIDPYLYLDFLSEAQYRVDGPQEAFYEYINVKTVNVDVYKIDAAEYLRRITTSMHSAPGSDPVWQEHFNVETPLNTKVVKKIDFSEGGKNPLEAGYYVLGVDSPEVEYDGKGRYISLRPFMVVADSINMKISQGNGLIWQTNLTSGDPVADSDVIIWTSKLKQIASGTTDQDGVFIFDLPDDFDERDVFAYSVDDEHLAFTAQAYFSGVSPSDFGLWSSYYNSSPYDSLRSYIYTDRPIYRPGQTVYFKGVVRNDKDLVYSLPGNKLGKVTIVVKNYEKEIYTSDLTLNEFGSFDGEFELSTGTTLGSYYIYVKDPVSDETLGSVDISVAEYRKPEFIVDVSVDPTEVTLGDEIAATIQSSFYSGGALANAPVVYTLRSSPFQFYPGGDFRGYNFNDVVNSYYGGASTDEFNRTISEGNGVTDAEGKLIVTIPADSRLTVGSQVLSFDASVYDVSGNVVNGQGQVIAHSSSIHSGVRSDSYVGKVGEEQLFNLAAVDWDGEPVSEQTLSTTIFKLEWYSVRKEDASGVLHWEYSNREIPIKKINSVQTDEEGLATVSFIPENGGTYFARVSTVDARGRQSQASAMMWVSSRDYIPWKQSDDRTFELVTDKDSYQPGEEAEVLIASPYQGETFALVTTERGLIRSQEVIRLTDNSTIYKLPITEDMAPTVYLSILVVKGVDETNPYPDFKVSMAAINVSTEQQELTVNLEADKMQAGPGDEVTYNVEVLDTDGEPTEAEVSLGLTDLSVLALMDSNAPSMLDYFYERRGLSVQTSIAITRNIESYNAELNETVTEGLTAGSGGGKGGGEYGVESVRQDFPDTPFWMPDAVTDEDGKTSVTVTLPDSLTTWRMDSRAINKDTQVGGNIVDIISTKPLMVRPQTPRFFVVGDVLTLGTAVHNNTAEDMQVRVSLEASGVELLTDVEQTVDILANQQVFVTWDVSVPYDAERADFIFRARSSEYSDASLPTLGTLDNQGIPVYRYEVPETVSTSGALSEGGLRTESIMLPQTMDVENGEMNITIEPSLLVGMQAGLDYLKHYPYECNEQTISRFLPNILTYKAMKAAGMQDAELEANLEREVNLAVQRLDNAQLSDGGWGWWPGSAKSNPTTSTYVMFGLWHAKEAGYDIDDEMIANGQEYLLYMIDHYAKLGDLETSYLIDTMTYMVYVMQLMDQPVVSYAVQLADSWKYLSLESQAYLAYTLNLINEDDKRIDILRNALMDEVILSASGAHWEEKTHNYWSWNTDTRSTSVILDTMIALEPDNPITANAVRWLMRNRTDGHWASTQETAWTLLSLTHWMEVSGDLEADYEFGLKFNGEEIGSGVVNQETLEEIRTLQVDVADFIADEINRLSIARTDGDGNMYYTADLNVYLPVDEVEALDQGVIISRNYFALDDHETPVVQANQGDMLMAQVTIVLPHASHYLLVEDMLPAGMEAVDTSLKTSEAYYGDLGLDSNNRRRWWYFDHTELRDEKVVFTAEYIPAGTYTYTYLVRASFPGTYNVIPPVAQEFYFPDVYGRGEGSQFVILP